MEIKTSIFGLIREKPSLFIL